MTAYFRQGVALQYLGRHADALAAFASGLAQDPKSLQLLVGMVEAAMKSPLRDSLEPTYQQLQKMKLDKSPFVVVSVIGQELLTAAHHGASVVVLEAALKIGTCSLKLRGSVFSALSSAYWSLGNTEKSTGYMQQDLEVAKTLVDWFLALELQQQVEKPEPSMGLVDTVAARDPSPTPQQPVGNPTLPQFPGRELPLTPPVQIPVYPFPPVPSPSPEPVEGVFSEWRTGVEKEKLKEPERPTPEWEEPERPTPEWEEPERPTPEWEEPERPTPEWEEPERPTPEWEEPERPTPEWEEPERPTPEWEEPERPTPEWEEPERPTPEWEEPERPTPEWEEPERPTPEWEEPERPTPEWGEPERPQPKRGESVRPQPKEGGVGASIAQEGEGGACRALGPKLPAEGECLLVPPPPAEGECLLSPCAPAEDECLLSPSPPAEGECLLGPRPPAEDECLLVSLPPPALTPAREGDKPQSPARKAEPHQSPAREAEQDQSPAKGGDYTLLPPSSPGDHMLLPPPLLPPQEPEGEELQAPPPENFWGGEGQDAGVPQQPLFMLLKAARRAPAQPPQRREPAPPGAEELELPLPPVPPPQGGRWPEPQKGELPATKKGEEVWRPLSPAAVSLQEFLWPEPHKGELPAMKKGEVGGPPAPAAFSLQELLWPEPHKGELPATKKGEVGAPPAPAAISLQEWTSMLSAVPLPAGVLTAWPAMGPVKPPLPARDFVLDCWVFKGGGGH
ncbi:UNVERIFIED_CONTAM: hypothetical protein FKN15_063353 [Acipenser sinensis]